MSKGKKIVVGIIIFIFLAILFVAIWAGIRSDKVDEEIVTIKSDIKELEVGWGYQLEVDKTIDRDHSIVYESSNTNLVIVDENGYIKALAPGEVTITAKVKGNKNVKDSIKVKVKAQDKNKMVLSEKTIYLTVGEERKIYIYNSKSDGYALWESEDPTIATVEDGKIKGVSLGEVNINVTNERNSKEMVKVYVIEESLADIELEDITFDKNKLLLDAGETVQLDVNYEPSDATDKKLRWISSDENVVKVDENGVITAVGNGSATVSATSNNGLVATCEAISTSNVIPVSNIKLNKDKLEIYVGDTFPIEYTIKPDNATSKNVVWESSNKSIAIVENGYILARKEGTATITVKTNNNKQARVVVTVKKKIINPYSITLDKSNVSINVGNTITLIPSIIPSNVTDKTLVWTSSDNSVATVNNGVVKGLKEGTTTIFVKTINGKETSTVVNVTKNIISISEISIDKSNVSMNVSESITLREVIKPSNATSGSVTWESSDPSIAKVSNGVVKAIKPGTVTITVRTDNGKVGTSKITVNKIKDVIEIRSKTAVYTGNSVNATITSKSGSNIKTTYYSDSKCSAKTNSTNANDVGASPKGTGNYYVIAETSGNENYDSASSDCIYAITIIKNQLTITCQNKEFNGKSQVIATCNGGSISNGTQTNSGSYQVGCKGDSNYADAESKTCQITPISIVNANISGLSDTTYTGSAITQTPVVKITLGGETKTLNNGTDYTYTITNNVDVGSATILITGKGNFKDSKEAKFNITKASPTITCVNRTYDGTNKTIATCIGGTLNGEKQINAGTYTVSCVGSGNYAGTIHKTCSISPYNISSGNVSGLHNVTYTGSAINLAPIVRVNLENASKTLDDGTDYTYITSNNTNAGKANVIINGKGNYTGTLNSSFTIDPAQITMECQNKTYNGQNQTIAKCTGGTLTNATQHSVGSYSVTCNGRGNYTGTITRTCQITPLSISSANVSGLSNYVYNGSPVTPTPKVILNVGGSYKELSNNVDYTYTISNNVNAGTATINIIGKGNYYGNKTVTFTISPAQVQLTCQNEYYTGYSQVIAKCTGGSLTNGTQTNAGSYTVRCTGSGNYSGTVSKTCEISPISISNATISGLNNVVYTGSTINQTPVVKITLNGSTKILNSGSDYTYTTTNNINVGQASVKITGKGNYSGTKTMYFTINPAQIQLTCQNKVFNGSNQVIATCTGGTINNATQKNVGSYNVSCTGSGNYTGTTGRLCQITAASISSATISGLSSVTYTGSPIVQSPKVTMNFNGSSITLVEGTDYTVTYANNTNAGTASVNIIGKGNYTGSRSTSFTIYRAPVTITCQNKTYNGSTQIIGTCTGGSVTNASQINAGTYNIGCNPDSSHTSTGTVPCKISPSPIGGSSITGLSSYTYTGNPITPTFTVKVTLNGTTKTLNKGTDYNVTYSNNTNVGSAQVSINGIGNFTGSRNTSFTINKASSTITCLNPMYSGYSQQIATCKGGSINNGSQTNAGNYTVSCSPDNNHSGSTNSCSILKAQDNPTIHKKTVTYGNPVTASVTAKTCSNSSCTISYFKDSSCTTQTGTPTDVGQYYVIVRTPGNNNYIGVTSPCTLAITITE